MTSNTHQIELDGNSLKIEDTCDLAEDPAHHIAILKEICNPAIRLCRKLVEKAVELSIIIYGITTGFASNAKTVIKDPEKAKELQRNLIMSHSCGVGDPFPLEIVRAAMLIRANTFARGNSGVRPELVEKLLEVLNADIVPYVPEKGSVGASGDLAPLSHMVLTILGLDQCFYQDRLMAATEALELAGIEPIELSYKEGLALNNGTPFMTALMCFVVRDAEILVKSADAICALSLEAAMGQTPAFDPRVHEARPHPGQITSAANVLRLVGESELVNMNQEVQDCYSFRCVPQVHGSCRDNIEHIRGVVERELNSSTDNPLIFPEKGVELDEENIKRCAISAGNFHGAPIAHVADLTKIVLTDLASISERRTAFMIDMGKYNVKGKVPYYLDEYLIKDTGLNCGFMIPQYTQAALVNDCKTLAHPNSVDSIPTGNMSEDHVSMGTNAARNANKVKENLSFVLAIELMNALQALDLRRISGSNGQSHFANAVLHKVRDELDVSFFEKDGIFYHHFNTLQEFVMRGGLLEIAESLGVTIE